MPAANSIPVIAIFSFFVFKNVRPIVIFLLRLKTIFLIFIIGYLYQEVKKTKF